MADVESLKKEKNELLKLINKEKLKNSKLRKHSTDNDFKLLQNGSTKSKWTVEAFLLNNTKDPMSYIEPFTPAVSPSKLMALEELINMTEEVLRVKCDSLMESDKDDGLQYVAKCSLLDTKLQFHLIFNCQNLDSAPIKLVGVKLSNSKQSTSVKPLVVKCIESNSIPMLIQGLTSHSELDCARPHLLEEIKKDFGSNILLSKEHPESGEITLHLVDPKTDRKLLEFKWLIAFHIPKNKFAYGFSMNTKSGGEWLRKEHSKLLNSIVNCTEMSEHMVDCWKQLCTEMVNRSDPGKQPRNK